MAEIEARTYLESIRRDDAQDRLHVELELDVVEDQEATSPFRQGDLLVELDRLRRPIRNIDTVDRDAVSFGDELGDGPVERRRGLGVISSARGERDRDTDRDRRSERSAVPLVLHPSLPPNEMAPWVSREAAAWLNRDRPESRQSSRKETLRRASGRWTSLARWQPHSAATSPSSRVVRWRRQVG